MSDQPADQHWQWQRHDDVAHLVFDRQGSRVNTFDGDALDQLECCLDAIAQAGAIRVVVVRSGKPGHFCAGADIHQLAQLHGAKVEDARRISERGQTVFNRLAALPSIALIDGACVGGGCELALACRARLAVDQARTSIGLPEVKLGIIPGWGGCARLPRLIGSRAAIDLICAGRTVNAHKAWRLGLVDRCLHPAEVEHGLTSAIDDLRQGRALNHHRRSLIDRILDGPARVLLARRASAAVSAKAGPHYPAPITACSVILEHGRSTLDQALAGEASAFANLAVGPVAAGLVQVFLANEGLKHITAADDDGIHRAAVIGAGVMGGGIAQRLARAGIQVGLKDLDQAALGRGLATAAAVTSAEATRKRLSPRHSAQTMLRISATTTDRALAQADFVLEAVVEDLAIKRQVLATAEEQLSDEAILATNTSSLRVADMASALRRPQRLCAVHFFNPVERMPLVEIAGGPDTDEMVIQRAVRLSRRLGKTPIVVGDCAGFLVNRILLPYLGEALHLLADGVSPERIDASATAYGMPMGPLRLIDEIGLDVGAKVAHILHDAYGDRMAVAPLFDALLAAGLRGRKGDGGFYQRDGRHLNSQADTVINTWRRDHGATTVNADDDHIRDRLILVMVNEAARCLDDGIISDPAALDMALILGTGFPPWRGGLLYDADRRGSAAIHDRLAALTDLAPARFKPAPLLVEHQRSGGSFHGH
ncbi:MAG: 3-hydroxyacyl-CoA dehydrogenase NAD-binding domain-containing protein [Planctomycetota bacterium]|jgi:3-hydroxyacyl-CoA dehydrogenase/enoyl-CoA hydratase/3-hydroxybutyryl-CoA epimerase